MSVRLLCCFGLLLLGGPGAAAQAPADTARGDRLLDTYFRHQVKQIADACLADVKDRAGWEKQRPELRRQFLEMLGLWPLPPRTDLKATVTGKVEADAFTVEKLHFQSSPGLYVTANLYVPKNVKFPVPGILYVCGHASTILDGVSYGHRINYQHHPAWFASNGYVCLIVDSLQFGEVQGIHHGSFTKHKMWWWQTLGYTPAGIECWNAMRALDYLQGRKEVDPKRLGVTGRSGGGATSWWVAAADERVQCAVPVAGIADLQAHLVGETPVPPGTTPRFRQGVLPGHCDCMYFVNTYRWDFAQVAALIAPRPLLLGNSDSDAIFPVPGYRRLADKAKRIYELYGAADRFALLETAGPHKDTPELRLGAYRWLNRWLKNDTGEVKEPERPRFTPQQLKVLDRLPDDALNAILHESFLRPARVELPMVPAVAKEWWSGKKIEWMQDLWDKVFRGWARQPPPLGARPAADVTHAGLRLRAFDFTSEEGVELRVSLLTGAKTERPKLVVLTAVDEAGWQQHVAGLGPAFREALLAAGEGKADETQLALNRKVLERNPWAFATIAPRGVGPTRWAAPAYAADQNVRRRFALVGQTLDGQRVWDVRRALAVLRGLPELKETALWLQGKGQMAGIALYAGLFEPDVVRLDLWHPPASHRAGPTFLNVRKTLDLPQALALAFPRRVFLYVADAAEAKAWEWPLQLQTALGQEYLKVRTVGR